MGGAVYGTTVCAGASGYGTVFKVAPVGAHTVVYSFKGGTDGAWPRYGRLINVGGTLYGTTQSGADSNSGTVFSVTTAGVERVFHAFHRGDRVAPSGGLINVGGAF